MLCVGLFIRGNPIVAWALETEFFESPGYNQWRQRQNKTTINALLHIVRLAKNCIAPRESL